MELSRNSEDLYCVLLVWHVACNISSPMFWNCVVTQKIHTAVCWRGDVARNISTLLFWDRVVTQKTLLWFSDMSHSAEELCSGFLATFVARGFEGFP